jgi:hypothetical protein
MTDNCISQSRIFGTAWLLSICELGKSQSGTLGQHPVALLVEGREVFQASKGLFGLNRSLISSGDQS